MFFSAAFIVQTLNVAFRIKNPRIRAILRTFPFLGALTALVLIPLNLNALHLPFLCQNCIQKSFISIFFPHFKSAYMADKNAFIHFITPNAMPNLYSLIFLGVSSLTVLLLGKAILKLFLESKHLKRTIKKAEIVNTEFLPENLQAALKKKRASVYLSSDINIPIATPSKEIILPHELIHKLTESEINSIIVHELEHIAFKDTKTRPLIYIIQKFFWWLPIKLWAKKIEDDQELHSDNAIARFGIKEEDLASALIKTTKHSRHTKLSPFCSFVGQKGLLKTRLSLLLKVGTAKEKFMGYGLLGAILAASISIACIYIF